MRQDDFNIRLADIQRRYMNELDLLEKYLQWYIKVSKPITLKEQILIFFKRGYIEHGKKENELPTFEQWKLIYNPNASRSASSGL